MKVPRGYFVEILAREAPDWNEVTLDRNGHKTVETGDLTEGLPGPGTMTIRMPLQLVAGANHLGSEVGFETANG